MMTATTTIIRMKMANSGASFPTSAASGLPPAALQPGAQAARRKLGADGIAGRDRRDDMQHSRQHGAQQELGEVQRRIGQDILLDDQRSRREGGGSSPAKSAAESRWPRRWRRQRARGLLPGVKNCLL